MLLSRPLLSWHLIRQRLVGLHGSMLLVPHGVIDERLGLVLCWHHAHRAICTRVRELRVLLIDHLIVVGIGLLRLLVRGLIVGLVSGLVGVA